MKLTSTPSEYERIGVLVARQSDSLAVIARRGYAEHGRGAVFFSEAWETTRLGVPPFYLPDSAPEFADVGADIERAVALYRPSSEGVVVVVTEQDEVYVVRLKLPPDETGEPGDNDSIGSSMH